MTLDEISPWLTTLAGRQQVRVTVRDGFEYEGFLLDAPEAGLYHVMPPPLGLATDGVLENIWAHDIVAIEPLPG